jgi:hypothetical protein
MFGLRLVGIFCSAILAFRGMAAIGALNERSK